MERRTPGKDRGRYGNGMSMSQGTPGIAGNHQELKQR